VDDDGKKDLILLGNLWFFRKWETPRNDASYGHLLKSIEDGNV